MPALLAVASCALQASEEPGAYGPNNAELAKALAPPAEAGRHTIFDTRFALQNHPIPDVELPGISTRLRTCSTGTARFDLGCEFTEEDGGFEVVWLYRPSVVSAAADANAASSTAARTREVQTRAEHMASTPAGDCGPGPMISRRLR